MPARIAEPARSSMLPAWLRAILACPRCGASLLMRDAALVCSGCATTFPTRPHVDLVAPGKRPPNEGPGDTAEMARKRVRWERRMAASAPGEQQAVAQYLEVIERRLGPGAVVVDLGCGTGSILRQVGRRFSGPMGLLGLEISRPMLDTCVRTLRDESRSCVVRASTRRRLPLADRSVDVALRRLAPALEDEIARVLKPGAWYVAASVAPDHWREVHDALPELPRPRARVERPDGCSAGAGGTPALPGHGHGGTWALPGLRRTSQDPGAFEVVERLTSRSVQVMTPAAALERLLAGPAAFHLDVARDLPRLRALAEAEGGRLSVTSSYVITVSRRSTHVGTHMLAPP